MLTFSRIRYIHDFFSWIFSWIFSCKLVISFLFPFDFQVSPRLPIQKTTCPLDNSHLWICLCFRAPLSPQIKISLSLSLLSPDLLVSFMSTPENKIFSGLQVLATMERLEKVHSFQEFVQIFSQFGNEMVEFAHLTGDRQNVRIYRRLKFSSTRILFWCTS